VIAEENLKTWLEAYGRAWENRDAESVAALFAENATYQETPFSEPLRGRAAVREYWRKVVVGGQEQIQFGFEILAIHGNLAFARWWSSFTRISAGKRVRLDGIFVLNFDDHNLCRDLREWWMRQEGIAP
jgi:ketosteroid isomerase-like protein